MYIYFILKKVNFDLSTGERKEYKTGTGETFTTITLGDIIFIDSPEGYDNLTEKSREVLEYLYLQEINNFDWFLKGNIALYG